MTNAGTTASPPRARTGPTPRWPVRAFVGCAATMAVLVLVQATSAGHLLTGRPGALTVHRELVFAAITWVALAEVAFAAAVLRPGRGSALPLLGAVLNVVALSLQIAAGFEGRLALHVPLGVSILALNLMLALTGPRLARRRAGRGSASVVPAGGD